MCVHIVCDHVHVCVLNIMCLCTESNDPNDLRHLGLGLVGQCCQNMTQNLLVNFKVKMVSELKHIIYSSK